MAQNSGQTLLQKFSIERRNYLKLKASNLDDSLDGAMPTCTPAQFWVFDDNGEFKGCGDCDSECDNGCW